MWSVLLLPCLFHLSSSSTSRACIDDSDCVDLGHKFACFLYKCYNWDEPSPEHPNCRYDWDCKNVRDGDKHECYRHWNLRAVNKGVCFSSYSLSPCYKHSDCIGGDSCCGTHCCPKPYFQQWKNFTCLSNQQCKTWMTGDKCCEDMRCCYQDAYEEIKDDSGDLIKDAIDVMEKHSSEDEDDSDGGDVVLGMTTEKDSGDHIKDAIDVMEKHISEDDVSEDEDIVSGITTEKDPEDLNKDAMEKQWIEKQYKDAIDEMEKQYTIDAMEKDVTTEVNDVTEITEHDAGDDSDDDNDIPELTEQGVGDDYQYGFGDSSEKDSDDDSDEGEKSLETDDNDLEVDSNELPNNNDDDDSEEVEKTSDATESPEIDLIQGQDIVSDTDGKDDEQVNKEIIEENSTHIENHTETDVSEDTTEGYKMQEKKKDDVIHKEEAYEEHHDNQEASKDSSSILDNNTVWEEEITETTLKPEETTVDAKEDDYEYGLGNDDSAKEKVPSTTTEPPIIEEEFEKEKKETIEFIPIEINELETNEKIEISEKLNLSHPRNTEKVSEKKDTEEISLTINPIRKQSQFVNSGHSTYSKTILVSIMGTLYVIRFLS